MVAVFYLIPLTEVCQGVNITPHNVWLTSLQTDWLQGFKIVWAPSKFVLVQNLKKKKIFWLVALNCKVPITTFLKENKA